MAFTRFPDPTNNISNLANQPVEPPATLKQKFDQFGEDSKDWTNNVFLPELESTTNGDSGADNVGATALSGGVANTVQGVVEELDAKILSQLPTPDGSITDVKLSNIAGQIKDVVSNHTTQLLGYVSVLSFGAIGDGIADDTVAFQNALLDSSKCVFIPSGTYKITSSLVLKTGHTIIGASKDKVVIESNIVGDSLFKTTDASVAFVTISNLSLKGNGIVGALGSGHAINFIDPAIGFGTFTPQNCIIEKVSIEDFLGFDKVNNSATLVESCGVIQVDGLQNVYRDMYISNCGHGFFFNMAQNTKIDNCAVDGALKYACFVYDSENVCVDKCDLINSGDGVESTGYPEVGLFTGILLSCKNSNFKVLNSKFKNTSGKAAIVSKFTDNDVYAYNWIRSASLTDVPHKAFYGERSQGVRIVGNTFDPAGTGFVTKKHEMIELYNASTAEGVSATIEDNLFASVGGHDTEYNIKLFGNNIVRTFVGVSIKNNKFGQRGSASSATTTTADILISTCTFKESTIDNNHFFAPTNVTKTSCVTVSSSTLSENTIGVNAFQTNGGTITAEYTGVTESVLNGTFVYDPANLADGAGETSGDITITGAALGDFVEVSAPYSLQGILCFGYVSASNTVKIRLQNETGAPIDLASGTWKIKVTKA